MPWRCNRKLRMSKEYEVVALMTSISEEYHRISHHGVREDLVEPQCSWRRFIAFRQISALHE